MPDLNSVRRHWGLNPDVAFLNHGSFGATPRVVLEYQRTLQDALERDPIEFLAPERDLEPKLDRIRGLIAKRVGANENDLVFVRNATDGVNAVMRSYPINAGDEVVITNHGYNACSNAVKFAAERAGGVVRVAKIPFPISRPQQVLDAIDAQLSKKTRVLIVDHVTSPTALVFPIQDIVSMAHGYGAKVLVDGAHAPGMLNLDLNDLAADFYTANHHKWLCGPKTSGFLWVRSEHQEYVRPVIISHGANRRRPDRSRFTAEFDWQGTFDPTPVLSLSAVLDFFEREWTGGLEEVMCHNHRLASKVRQLFEESLGSGPGTGEPAAPSEMIGSMVAVPLPSELCTTEIDGSDSLQSWLFNVHQIELPIFPGIQQGQHVLRVSCQIYNEFGEYERVVNAIKSLMPKSVGM